MEHQYKVTLQYRPDPQNKSAPTRHGVIKELKPNLKYIVKTDGQKEIYITGI
ncbi:1427_t:CDS:2 [Funneliformis geosporum]|nr:1427_t:CDS:2 [Funneliformis geosporum]